MARGQNEFSYESKVAANQGLSEGFLKILTGGKTGAEAEQYAKEQFGGQYLPAQAMSIAADHLRDLTHDFDENDWTITGKYMELMAEVPAVREELRAKIETQDQNDHKTKVETASLLLDETWRMYNENRKIFEYGETKSFEREKYERGLAAAREKLGLDVYDKQTDRIKAGTSATNAATSAKNAQIRNAELALKKANQQYTKAKDKITQRNAQENINIAKGNLEVARLKAKIDAQKASKPKPGAAKPKPLTAAKKQELSQIAFDTASDDFDSGTKPVETLRDLIAAGVPFSIAIRAIQRYGKDPSADAYWAATLGWKK
jgi:hypothetical protein